jgi:hypothetical protein
MYFKFTMQILNLDITKPLCFFNCHHYMIQFWSEYKAPSL